MMTDLKPCPFCGKEYITVETDYKISAKAPEEGTGYFAANCNYLIGGCGATCGYRKTEQEAIEAWNRRA